MWPPSDPGARWIDAANGKPLGPSSSTCGASATAEGLNAAYGADSRSPTGCMHVNSAETRRVRFGRRLTRRQPHRMLSCHVPTAPTALARMPRPYRGHPGHGSHWLPTDVLRGCRGLLPATACCEGEDLACTTTHIAEHQLSVPPRRSLATDSPPLPSASPPHPNRGPYAGSTRMLTMAPLGVVLQRWPCEWRPAHAHAPRLCMHAWPLCMHPHRTSAARCVWGGSVRCRAEARKTPVEKEVACVQQPALVGPLPPAAAAASAAAYMEALRPTPPPLPAGRLPAAPGTFRLEQSPCGAVQSLKQRV